MSAEAVRQKQASISSDESERRAFQAEHAAETERLNVANTVSREKERRMRASLVRAETVKAARIADPVGLNMSRAPSGKDLDNFERDPVQSILMMHSMFGNDFLLTPPPRNMTASEEQEYKDALYEQCAVSEETMENCISQYKDEMSSER